MRRRKQDNATYEYKPMDRHLKHPYRRMATVDTDELCIMILNGVPKRIRNDFKKWCRHQGVSMTYKLIRYMKKAVKKEIL